MIVFPESETSLAVGLARWIEPQNPEAGSAVGSAAASENAASAVPEPEGGVPSAFETECIKLEAAKDFKTLSGKLREGLKRKFANANAADVQNAYAVLLELLVQWQLLASEAQGLADELAANTEELPERRIAVLLSLYALAQQDGAPPELRFTMLLRLITFCTKTSQLSKVLGNEADRVERVDRWVQDWQLTVSQQKELWGVVFDAHSANSHVMYDCALKYFALHDGVDLKAETVLRERLIQGVLLTIRSPDLFRCGELSQLQVVQQLANEPELRNLHKMLQIMAHETYAEYLAFSEEQLVRTFMSKHGIAEEDCARKMRLLTLVSLGHDTKELSYAVIADALKIERTEVETWVMLALASGLITAKMDQVREVVAVSMCAERDFGKSQWEQLHGSLVDWRDSIRNLLTIMQDARPAA